MNDSTRPPKVSVLMPVYNGERFLVSAVNSALTQSFRDFEFIAVDSSTDRSTEMLRRFAARDPRVRLLERPNHDLSQALNEGLAAARGEYIARMDADDISLPGRFAAQVEFLDRNPDHVAIGAYSQLVDEDGDPIGPMPMPANHEEIDEVNIRGDGCVLLHTIAMIRREPLLRIGYNTEYPEAQDYDLFLKLSEIGKLANLPKTYCKVRYHSGSVSRQRRISQQEQVWRAVAAARRRRGLPMLADPQFKLLPHETDRLEASWLWTRRSFTYGHKTAAWKHAMKCVARNNPLSWRAWRPLAFLILGAEAFERLSRVRGIAARSSPA